MNKHKVTLELRMEAHKVTLELHIQANYWAASSSLLTKLNKYIKDNYYYQSQLQDFQAHLLKINKAK